MSQDAVARPAARAAVSDTGVRWRLAERPFVWLAPLALLLVVTYVYPAIDVIRYSFTDATLLNPQYAYTADSYRSVATNPDLPGILWVTLLFVVASVILQLVLGLLVAMVLHRGVKRRLPGVAAVRIIILSAWIVPGVAAGIVWQLMFNEASYGFLNAMLRGAGISPVAWLSDPDIALWSAVIANVWRGTAFSMLLLYAGLVVIPSSLYEAASVDGATPLKQFWYITLPQLRPILLINTVLISIFTLNTFDLILPLTGGGPGRATEVLALYTYNAVFRNFDLSSGAVLAVLLLAISVVFTLIYVRLLPREL
ncbi:carbohydrate ABC transporter permease [Chelativorans salis]|uniref:Sugar ABC transporter permease n=1 Tax=Chelativorans salis TaxID=2978478 RepID=A0ABT2LW09_9HYPH|nr:sugar ABC transporter permease [Chelativorans sp. EGI FJ00035]MCT7378057.1 sugar ABC transporter permease [Chelativorans sp. EGI FJ00035]